jgi:hypothetical protein
LTTNSNCKTKYSASKSALERLLNCKKEAARGTELAVQKFQSGGLEIAAWNMILIKISRRQRIELISLLSFSSGNNKRQNRGFKYCSRSIYAGIPSQLQQIVQILNKPN